MPTLHVRNVPADLYERLASNAEKQRRSLSAEVITLLTRALRNTERAPEEIRASIAERCRFSPAAVGAPDSTTLLREDRDR